MKGEWGIKKENEEKGRYSRRMKRLTDIENGEGETEKEWKGKDMGKEKGESGDP